MPDLFRMSIFCETNITTIVVSIIFLRRLRSLVYADWLDRYFNQSPDTKLRKRRRNIMPSPLVRKCICFAVNTHQWYSFVIHVYEQLMQRTTMKRHVHGLTMAQVAE